MFKRFFTEQTGGALIYALLMLFVGSVTLPPLMDYVGTGLRSAHMFERKSNEIYAADSGIEDALWKIRYGDLTGIFTSPAYDIYDYTTEYSYTLSEEINDCEVEVSLQNMWIPKDIETPTAAEAATIIGNSKLVVTGNTPDATTYEIRAAYYPEVGDGDLFVEKLGIWLPVGFSYVAGSSNLEEVTMPLSPYYAVPTVESYYGGEAVVWDFSSVDFNDFPGIDLADTPLTTGITFQFDSILDNTLPVAIAWVETSGVADIEFSWDADVRIFEFTSTAGDATAEAHAAKCEVRELSARIDGDYRAIGNSLMIDGSGPDSKARYDLLAGSSAEISDIPSDAEVVAAHLYWSGWIENPIIEELIWQDDCADFDNWEDDDDWSISSGQFRGHHDDDSRHLAMDSSVDLSAYSGQNITVSWGQDEDGYLENDDRLYCAFSADDGNTWSSNIEVFRDDNPSSSFTYSIPSEYLTDEFRMRFYLYGFSGYGEYCYIDNIAVAKSAFADTSATFKIDGTQVYFDGDDLPQEDLTGIEEINASKYTYLENNPGEYSYSCYLDVTDLVREFSATGDGENRPGNATFTVGDVYADTGNKWSYAGWSLITIYSSVDTHGHQLFLYDDFHYADENQNIDFDDDGENGGKITGFIIPDKIDGEINAAKLTCFVGEGDVWYSGDHIKLNNTSLFNAESPLDNVWNSQSPGMSEDGVDIDTFEITWASNVLESGDTSAQLDLPTGTDSWNLVYVILSVRSETVTPGAMDYVVHF